MSFIAQRMIDKDLPTASEFVGGMLTMGAVIFFI